MKLDFAIEPPMPTVVWKGWDRRSLERLHQEYTGNDPFPHVVIDGLFPEQVLDAVVKELEKVEYAESRSFYGADWKFAQPDPYRHGPATRRLLHDLNARPFIELVEGVTGIAGLIPDPHYFGGGYHEIRSGGFLKMHTDFNWHNKLKLDRRVNVLIYLNRDWQESWGGDLRLSSAELKEFKCIWPTFNRMVIFGTTDHSFHGHPDPIIVRGSIVRRSLALYYYSSGRPAEEILRAKATNTTYRERTGESFHETRLQKLKRRVSRVFR